VREFFAEVRGWERSSFCDRRELIDHQGGGKSIRVKASHSDRGEKEGKEVARGEKEYSFMKGQTWETARGDVEKRNKRNSRWT